jgi:hypothetical protein
MFSLTAIGMIILDKTNKAQVSRGNRIILLGIGAGCVAIGYMTTRMFIKVTIYNLRTLLNEYGSYF